jgi:hypothetical protein
VVARAEKSRRISQIITAERVVRNDEAVGSIPTSSTNLFYQLHNSTPVSSY